ncbi:MAG: GMC family oxidoreductase [Verrucomicrobiota bacterium]|nr:GMC family oxidoreductase [Verrucomicrobiota bacterium]
MPHINAGKTKPEYDVIVVGSGAAGGQTAYTLAMEGVKVLMLEAGRDYDPVTETPMFNTRQQAPLRDAGTPEKPFGFYDATSDGGWKVPHEPYTNASDKAEEQFWWWRARMLGGRTNHWGRISLRNGPYDFKGRSRDGVGWDWPLEYDDVAPYYDKVESLIGVYGSNEGLENTPNSPDGVLHPPPKARASEIFTHKHAKKLGIPVIPIHRAVMTQRMDSKRIPKRLHPNNPKAAKTLAQEMDQRLACFWATPCGRGCSIKANYQSTTVHIPPALASGNLDIITKAMAHEVEIDSHGKATGVKFIDKTTGLDYSVKGRTIALAASSCETVRILLNSKSSLFPNGLANGSGLVGKYIMDTVGARLGGQVPAMENMPPHNEDGAGGSHSYVPWWLYKEQLAGKLDFPRGYHIEMGGSRGLPRVGTFDGLERFTGGSYGKQLKEDAKRYYGSFVGFSGRGEMVPNENCYCDIDPTVRDKWGIPVLRFHWKWADYEIRQAAHMHKTFAELITEMGGTILDEVDSTGKKAIYPGGEIIHEVGGAIMGNDPSTSVANQYSQTHEVSNLFLTDGAPFCSNADKNPTLTIMALAWRSADYMMDQMKKGNI